MRQLLQQTRTRLAQLPIGLLPGLSLGVLAALLITNQWAIQSSTEIQKALDQQLEVLQARQRQQYELLQLQQGLATHQPKRREGTLEERMRHLATDAGLQIVSLEQLPVRNNARDATRESLFTFSGSLSQIEASLRALPAQLEPKQSASILLDPLSSQANIRKLRLSLRILTDPNAQTTETGPGFWEWLTRKPTEHALGPRNPMQLTPSHLPNRSKGDANNPLLQHDLANLTIVGTLIDTKRDQSRALVQLPGGRIVSARIGDAIGRDKARILAIMPRHIEILLQRLDDSAKPAKLRREHQRLNVQAAQSGAPAP